MDIFSTETLTRFFIIYIIFFSINMIYFFFRNRKNNKPTIEMVYMSNKYKINLSNIDYNELCRNISLINSFIYTIVLFISFYISNYLIRIFVIFICVFVLIAILYKILGEHYSKKS